MAAMKAPEESTTMTTGAAIQGSPAVRRSTNNDDELPVSDDFEAIQPAEEQPHRQQSHSNDFTRKVQQRHSPTSPVFIKWSISDKKLSKIILLLSTINFFRVRLPLYFSPFSLQQLQPLSTLPWKVWESIAPTSSVSFRRRQEGRNLLWSPPSTTNTDKGKLGTENVNRRQLRQVNRSRVLYIITSVTDKDTGKRETIKDYDRFGKTMVPLIKESVTSMSTKYDVDLYLIAHYNVTNDYIELLQNALPPSVGLQVWPDASPLGYSIEHSKEKIQDIVRALSRQHRYVIKDKFLHYDIFVNFEDDMLIKAEHIEQFVETTQTLYNLRLQSGEKWEGMPDLREMRKRFYGNMTKLQLERMIPGFFRVEVNIGLEGGPGRNKVNHCGHALNRFPQIPQDYIWNETVPNASLDASFCCHLQFNETLNEFRPNPTPVATDLYYWETGIEALGVRQLPNHQWYMLLVGNLEDQYYDNRFPIGDYWSGRDGYFLQEPEGGGFVARHNEDRPPRTKGRYMNNQGGWMATQRQVFDWHRKLCKGGGYLPPFNPPGYELDGLDLRSVEYWSGGLQITGPLGCNLQRVMNLDPAHFSKHLLYHTSNNKQRSHNVGHRYSGLSIQEFWAQLNTVRKNAEKAMEIELKSAPSKQ